MTERVENDSDVCLECGALEGEEHDKVKHLALPKGTMAYDQIVFEQDSKSE